MPFFESWSSLGRTLLAGLISYPALVLFLRVSGKRTLSKLNAFDFVVTVALGSTLAAVLVQGSVPFVDGLLALAMLIALQYAVAWLMVRSPGFRRAIRSEPTLLFHGGRYLESALRRERVGDDEVLAAVRASGFADVGEVHAVVLETDGSLSVLSAPGAEVRSPSLASVSAPECSARPGE